jgi:L-fucose isomerase-like protein
MMNMASRFGLIPVASKFISEKQLQQLLTDYVPALEVLGAEQWHRDAIENRAPLVFFVATGGTEQEILHLLEKRKQTVKQEPVFLLTHPGNNALPAAMEVLARLQQDGERGRILFFHGPKDESGVQELARAIDDLEVLRDLREAKIGFIGGPSDWLVASSPDPLTVSDVWGPAVVPIEWVDLREAIQGVPQAAVEPCTESLVSSACDILEPTRLDLENAVRGYLGLKHLVSKHQLDAVTLRCFDLILDSSITGCFALAQLNDVGIIAACEGDLVSTVGMLWAYKLLDQNPWMANPVRLDKEDNTLWMAHCTVPRSVVEDYRLRSHFESGLGVALQGRLRFDAVTLIRIGGQSMNRLWLADGEILQAGDAEDLCRTQVKVRLSSKVSVLELLHAPLGNHLVLIHGHHAEHMRRWWKDMMGE